MVEFPTECKINCTNPERDIQMVNCAAHGKFTVARGNKPSLYTRIHARFRQQQKQQLRQAFFSEETECSLLCAKA